MNYDIIYKSYDNLYIEEQTRKLNIISKIIKVRKTDKLLDIGCGTTVSTNFFKCFSIGIDSEFNMLNTGKGNRICGYAESLPFKNNSFDIILAITSVHHFNDLKRAISEIKRTAKQNSKIVITLLKKSERFDRIKAALMENFNLNIVEEDKDIIFYN